MQKGYTVVPAYGRDYKSKAEVTEAWTTHKDFQIASTGQYITIDEARRHNLTITVRYDRLRKSVVVSNNA